MGWVFFPPIPSFPIIPSIPSNPYSTTFSSSLLFCTARRYGLQALTPGNQGPALVLQRPTTYFIIIITGMHERVCACANLPQAVRPHVRQNSSAELKTAVIPNQSKRRVVSSIKSKLRRNTCLELLFKNLNCHFTANPAWTWSNKVLVWTIMWMSGNRCNRWWLLYKPF